MPLLTAIDFNTHIYPELVSAISRGDTTVIDSAIAAAEGEAKGYLSRYDLTTLFGAVGTARDATLLMFLKDLTVWHFIALGNPNTDMALRKTRHDDAISWLKDIQAGKTSPQGWPLPNPEVEGTDIWSVGSQPKRETRY